MRDGLPVLDTAALAGWLDAGKHMTEIVAHLLGQAGAAPAGAGGLWSGPGSANAQMRQLRHMHAMASAPLTHNLSQSSCHRVQVQCEGWSGNAGALREAWHLGEGWAGAGLAAGHAVRLCGSATPSRVCRCAQVRSSSSAPAPAPPAAPTGASGPSFASSGPPLRAGLAPAALSAAPPPSPAPCVLPLGAGNASRPSSELRAGSGSAAEALAAPSSGRPLEAGARSTALSSSPFLPGQPPPSPPPATPDDLLPASLAGALSVDALLRGPPASPPDAPLHGRAASEAACAIMPGRALGGSVLAPCSRPGAALLQAAGMRRLQRWRALEPLQHSLSGLLLMLCPAGHPATAFASRP